jgi:hypothetical protein
MSLVAGRLDPEQVRRALAHPTIGPQLAALGVRFYETIGGGFVRCPAAQQEVAAELVELAHEREPSVEQDDLVGGRPYLKADYEVAGRLHDKGKMTVEGIKTRRDLSTRRAHRLYRQFQQRAVLYDHQVGLRPGPDYRWDPRGLDSDPPTYKLIRR